MRSICHHHGCPINLLLWPLHFLSTQEALWTAYTKTPPKHHLGCLSPSTGQNWTTIAHFDRNKKGFGSTVAIFVIIASLPQIVHFFNPLWHHGAGRCCDTLRIGGISTFPRPILLAHVAIALLCSGTVHFLPTSHRGDCTERTVSLFLLDARATVQKKRPMSGEVP